MALGLAHKSLREDRDIVLTAVKQDGEALGLADVELKNDREVRCLFSASDDAEY